MGKLKRAVYVLLNENGTVVFNGVGNTAHEAWESFVLWHFGTLYGRADYRTKKTKVMKTGIRCYKMKRT